MSTCGILNSGSRPGAELQVECLEEGVQVHAPTYEPHQPRPV